ncbi:MAG: GDSL-type esterase/lipase family protein [Kiritimatiellae bacterium]|jgi:lysophospholipase L1-like esterase|nr:GDSL-type esterase/lipase family protein [Kiritimatiellia bacterium]
MSFRHSSCVILFALFSAISAVNLIAETPEIRIMPLGDSITYGSGAAGGYRLPLYIALTNAGYNIDYVGDNTGNSAPGLGTEINHAGYGGWRVSHYDIGLYEHLYGWFETIADPHVVLIHAGTNDTNDPDFEHCIDEMDAMVTRIAESQPSAKIIVTTIMKRGATDLSTGSYINITNYFNPYVYPLVTNHVAQGHDVHYLDMHAFVELADMDDNLHPNAVGYQKMADAWFPAITNIIGINVTANLPAPMRCTNNNYSRTGATISFNKAISPETATNTANYVISGSITATAATISGDHRSVTLTTSEQAVNTTYTVTMNNIEDETEPTALTIPDDSTVQFDSPIAPTLISASGSSDNLKYAALLFSKSMSESTTTNTSNYAIDNGITVENASLSSDHLTVTLTTSVQSSDTTYTVTVNNVADESTPTPIPIASDSTAQFNAPTAPTLVSATGSEDNQQVAVLFSKGVSETTATNTNYYAIDYGITVTGATLSSDHLTVTLATSLQIPGTNYTVTVSNVADETTPTPITIPAGSQTSFIAQLPRGYDKYIPESEYVDYTVVYSLDLPNQANYINDSVPYNVDISGKVIPFSRVAYYLELQKTGGGMQYLWVSMDAFTTQANKLGIPTFSSGAVHQQILTNMNIFCNVAGVDTGTDIDTGNIEFWPWDYSGYNAKTIPNASGSTYDFGDQCKYTGNYGCMQVHNHGASDVLFAINHWNTGSTLQVGIGNNPTAHPDWTTSDNASSYTIKTMQVLVKCDPSLDTTPPSPTSALSGASGQGITVSFDEVLSASSADSSLFSLDKGVEVLSATLSDDQKTIDLVTTRQPTGLTLTLSIEGVYDLSGNPVPAGTSIAVSTLPAEITSNIGTLADNYNLVYTLDIPVTGNFNGTSDFYQFNQSDLSCDFDRIAYYVEVETTGGTVQYLWASMDAFTDDAKKIGVPIASLGTVWQQTVGNLDVKSNVAGVSNGTSMVGGNLEFWSSDYTESNSASVPGASDTAFDFGDAGASSSAGHGSMQIHNYAASQTLFAMSNFGADNKTLAVGIGTQPSDSPDWTHADNADSYTSRTLHILIRPEAAPALPPVVEANIPQAAGYQLAYTIDLPVNGSFNNNSEAYYSVNNVTNGVVTDFSRIAYYMEVVPNSTTTTQYIWTAMDAFTTDARKIGVPTNSIVFQQKVTHLEVQSNVEGIINGSDIATGNIEFWPSSYGDDNGAGVPNASSDTFDFGDIAYGSDTGYGSMQVHNYGIGATQTLFAVNNFNDNSSLCVGIGNNSGPDGYPDWTHSYSASDYSFRRMYVFVLPGTADGDTTQPTLIRANASISLNQINVRFSETISNSADTPSFYTINNGVTVTDAMMSSDNKSVILDTSALTPDLSYTITVSGVRDNSINYNAIIPYSTISFTTLSFVAPNVLTNITEAADYQLIHQLSIDDNTSYENGCNYTIDQSFFPATQAFDRIAYCMELENAGTGYHWVYVSMDAFATDLSKIGVPTLDRDKIWQQYVSNLNVYASANIANNTVTTGVGIASGNIEFWPYNYSTANGISIPGASESTYDFGDVISSSTAGYGSMQVHNYAEGHTIFAMNNWGSNNREPCIGIGNDPRTERDRYAPDWTFGDNAADYTIKNIYVLVRPSSATSAGSPPEIWSQPQSQSLYLEESARLTVYSPDATSYQWRKDGSWITGANQPWLDFAPVIANDDGVYDVIVTGADGYTTSHSATLQVFPYTRPEPPKTIRIMPLGDSITYGVPVVGGYRIPLYSALTDAGYNVDYVGTQTSNSEGMADPDHEGHSGWTIGGLDANIALWLSQIEAPDVVLLHIGTNDSGAGDFSNRVDRLDDLVTKIAVNSPHANIIVTTLLKRSDTTRYTAITNLFNPYVEGKVLGQQALGHKVHYLDMHAYLELSDMDDGLHPNSDGYQKMADAWFPAITNVVSPYGDSSAPALIQAVALNGLESVQVDFSKSMDPETATNTAYYTLNNGATINSATPSEDMRSVILSTSPLTHNTIYTLTVNNVQDYSWPVQQAIAANSSDTFQATIRGYLNNVPESADYRLVYAVDLPTSAAYGSTLVNYNTDNTSLYSAPLARIAYYLELQSLGGELTYLWVSMDSFTEDATKVGIPTKISGAVFQQLVNNMNIYCNVAGVTTGTNISGNVEFWPTDYSANNAAGISGASNSAYDFGDERKTTGSHGSMQVHNTGAGETLFAFNNWGSSGGSKPGIGIGNCPAPQNNGIDWTFTSNADTYTIRSLYVLATIGDDNTPPTLVSALAGSAGSLVTVTFSEALASDSVDGTRFALDNGVSVIDAELLSDKKTVYLTTTPLPADTTLTLTVNGVRDSGGGNPIAPNSTIVVAAAALPAEVTANAGALADDFELVYTLDIPVTGSFNAADDPYIYNQSSATGAFDRVAYYLELVTASGSTQYVWTAMDAFTQFRSQIGVPLSSTKAIFQQTVNNLDVQSNVSGVDNGTSLATGNLEFWPTSYTAANAIGIPNASDSNYDFGDTRTAGSYGSMQIHNHGASETVLALNNWGADGEAICVGIGNRSTSYPDWTHAYNAGSYVSRTLHVMVRPSAAVPAADLPTDIAANVASAANGYQLICSITNIPINASFNSTTTDYIVDKRGLIADGSFSRIAYYIELETATSNQWVWTAMDSFTTDPERISIPLAGAIFQQKVNNLDVLSNDGNIQTGTGITTGNIEFWPGNYNQSNALGIPNASGGYFDFGDGGASSITGHGSMQVHNYGAQQTIWAINHFNNGAIPGLGIGNENEPGTGHSDYTHAANATDYTRRVLHILVLPGCQADAVKPTLSNATASRALNMLTVSFSEELSDNAASEGTFTLDQGVTVSSATLLPNNKDIILETSAMTAEHGYTLTVSGVRDRSPCDNVIIAGSTIGFTAPTTELPPVLLNVPEIGDYELIHQLAIENNVSYNPDGAPYSVDESLYAQGSFDRIAYCMELTGTNGFAQWVYVSADAFTSDITKIGVPTLNRDTIFQQYISNLNVYASANIAGDTVTTGTGIQTGNIEFWPSNYQEPNALGIPGASSSVFDFGDTRSAGEYGSMQLHNTAATQTIFAMNHWGSNGYRPCLGIGNQPTGSPDWTHTENAQTYTLKNLYVLVRWGNITPPTSSGPDIFVQPESSSVLSGKNAYFYVYAPGATGYQWRKNGVWVPGATQSTLEFTAATLSDIASYDVIVISDEGSTLSESATLSVTETGTLIILR